MPIERIDVAHSDLERRGGLKCLGVFLFEDLSGVTFDSDANHSITAITDTDGVLFEIKQGTGSLVSTGTKENGTIMFEHTVTAYIPNMSDAHLSALDLIGNENLVVMAQDFNDATYCVGISNAYSIDGGATGINDQMFAKLTSVEMNSGSALTDETGVTITFTAMSGELPYIISPAVTINTGSGTFAIG